MEVKYKYCTNCIKKKNLDEFYGHPNTIDKKQSICKECAAKASKAQRSQNGYKEKFTEYMSKWRKENREKYRKYQRIYQQKYYHEVKKKKK